MNTFFQISAIFLVIISTYFLALGSLALSPRDILEISATRFGYSPYVVASLSEQQANARVGIVIMVLSLVFQMVTLFLQTKKSATKFEGQMFANKKGIIAAIIFAVVVSWFGFFISNTLDSSTKQAIVEIRSGS